MKVKKIISKLLKIFLGTNSAQEMKKKGIMLSIAIPTFRWIDWLAVGFTASLVALLKTYNLPNSIIFLILWGANIVYSGSVVFISDKYQVDVTLSEGLRRLVNAAIEKSKITGYLLEVILVVRLVIWDGPDNFIIFFRQRLKGVWKIIVFIAASGLQMAIWTAIYVAGYEGISELLRGLQK